MDPISKIQTDQNFNSIRLALSRMELNWFCSINKDELAMEPSSVICAACWHVDLQLSTPFLFPLLI